MDVTAICGMLACVFGHLAGFFYVFGSWMVCTMMRICFGRVSQYFVLYEQSLKYFHGK